MTLICPYRLVGLNLTGMLTGSILEVFLLIHHHPTFTDSNLHLDNTARQSFPNFQMTSIMESQRPSLGTTIRSFTHPSHTTYTPHSTLPPDVTWKSTNKSRESSDEFSDAVEYNSDDDEFSDALESQPVSQISNWRSRWASSKPLTTLRSYYDRTKTGM